MADRRPPAAAREMGFVRRLLPNGVRLLCEPVPVFRSVSVGLFVDVGSRDESEREGGASHLIEHLVFKGSERYTARQLAERIDAVGGQLNAYTTREYTCFYTRVLAEHLPVAVDVLADMVARPRLDDEDTARERQVVLEELGLVEDSAEELVSDLFYQALWPHDAFGLPIAGTVASVSALDAASLRAFHHRHYTGPNTVVAIAGGVEPDAACELLAAALSALPDGPVRPRRRPPLPAPGRLRRSRKAEQVQVCFGTPAPDLRDDDLWPTALLGSILGGGASSRLFQAIREERGLCYDVEAFHQADSDNGAFGIGLAASPATVGRAVGLARREWRRLQQRAVPPEELRRHQDQFRAATWLALESAQSRMGHLGRSEVLLGHVPDTAEAVARVESVDAAALQDLARRLGDPEGWAAAAVGPRRALARAWEWSEAAAFR